MAPSQSRKARRLDGQQSYLDALNFKLDDDDSELSPLFPRICATCSRLLLQIGRRSPFDSGVRLGTPSERRGAGSPVSVKPSSRLGRERDVEQPNQPDVPRRAALCGLRGRDEPPRVVRAAPRAIIHRTGPQPGNARSFYGSIQHRQRRIVAKDLRGGRVGRH
jgi:hypothetical protein